MKKNLCFIAYSEEVCQSIKESLEEALGEFLNIDVWCLECDPQKAPGDHDLYVASHCSTFLHVQPLLPPHKKIITAKRFINPVNFEKLLHLKPGTKAILCARSQDRTEYIHDAIHSFGIKHVELFHCYDGQKTKPPYDAKTAIVAGLNSHVPQWVTSVIDIGAKEISIETYTKIIGVFSINDTVLNDIVAKYMRSVFTITRKYYEMKKKSETILQSVDSAVLSLDADGMIDAANDAAVYSFRLGNTARSTHISEVFPEYARLADRLRLAGNTSEIMEADSQQYALTTRAVLDDSGAPLGSVITANPVSKVQELEKQVRLKLKNKGHIAKHSFGQIIGLSPEIHKAISLAKRFARTDLAILLEGESGSGKELFAQSIHAYSDRADSPFVALNFAALPESLAESELFGHEEGAFTGALRGGRQGLFEEAHNGTIFLDEIGDASLELQTKLLRVLEEKEVRHVGGRSVIPVNVRVVAATNKNLAVMMQRGLFRSDLFYRLCACPLRVPPLRRRQGDIFLLIQEFAVRQFRHSLTLDSETEDFLKKYPWPGNVRELQNVVNYICNVMRKNDTVTLDHLPEYVFSHAAPQTQDSVGTPEQDDLSWHLAVLQRKGIFEPCKAILAEFARLASRNKSIGRYALLEMLQAYGLDIPAHRLRACLAFLKEGDFLSSGVTKQGSRLTDKGQALLRRMNAGASD